MNIRLILTLALLSLGAATASAQTKTTETRTTETESDTTSDGKVKTTETVTAIASSEDITIRNHMIIVDPIKFFALFNLGYQHAITQNVTVGGSIQAPTQLVEASGFGVAVEGRLYPAGRTFRSFHVGANAAFNDITTTHYNWETDETEEIEIAPFSMGVNVGWHWYPWDDFATEFVLGADYNFSGKEGGDMMSSDVPFLSDRKGLMPSFRFTIGYAW